MIKEKPLDWKEIILIKYRKYKRAIVMIFACKYFNSKHEDIS
jgi:hypothetical protein